MRRLTGLQKELILLRNAKNKALNKLPLSVKTYLHTTFKDAKVTQLNGEYIVNTFMPPLKSKAFERLTKNTVAVYNHDIFPYSTYVAVTNKCRFNCWHCSKAHRNGKEIDTASWINTMEKLQDAGISIIGFTGGEPLLRSDLEGIISSVDERSATILFTTGDGLSDERAKSLKKAGLKYIAISLDHFSEEKHNALRGLDTAFDIAVNAIKTSVKNGFYTAAQLTPRKEMMNQEELDKYIVFLRELGAHEIRIVEPMPAGKLLKDHENVLLNASDHDLIKKYHIEINKNKDLPTIASFVYLEDKELYGCGAGVQHMFIDAFGNVCPCDFMPLSFGNIFQEGFDAVYQKLRKQFNRPRAKCFILENAKKISDCFDEKLPLAYEDSVKICEKCKSKNLPKFYQKLGWK